MIDDYDFDEIEEYEDASEFQDSYIEELKISENDFEEFESLIQPENSFGGSNKPKRMSHHYTDELELKSLLIRLKNSKILEDAELKCKNKLKHEEVLILNDIIDYQYDERMNSWINSDIKRFVNIKHNLKKYDEIQTSVNQKERIRKLQDNLKERIIRNSEKTLCDKISQERFGEIVILMVKNILRKPNFQMLDYHDDFYSDQSYKIFRYMRNFDHTKISKRSGYYVNAFQYVSQIIHNSVLFVINQRKKESDKIINYYEENPFSNVSFLNDENTDDEIFSILRRICPLEFPFLIEDQYPFVIKDLLAFLESNYSRDSKESMLQIILDYSESSGLGEILVGDQIRSDEYLVKFVESFQVKQELKAQNW